MDIQTFWNDNVRGLVLYARQWIACEAEDVVQDAFLKLLTAIPPPDHPKARLYRVVRNAAIDRQRKNRWNKPLLENWFERLPDQA